MSSKLIALPANDPDNARNLLQQWLAEDDKILLIVLGDTNIAFTTAERADRMTGGIIEEPRWVIHGPNREGIMDILENLSDPDDLVEDWNDILFVTLSLDDVIRDVVIRDGTLPTFSRIDDAFMIAEEG